MIATTQGNWRRIMIAIALTAALAASLGACGKKADLDPPPGEPDNYGHQYPDPGLE